MLVNPMKHVDNADMASGARRLPRVLVVGTDFSAESEGALTRAIQIASTHGASVHVVHAAPRIPRALARRFSISDDRKLREALETAVEQLSKAGVRGRAHLVQGDPVKALTVKARAFAADLVVVGSRGRSVQDAVLGSTAERLSAYDRHRVLLVRRASTRPYREVLIAASEESDLRAQVASAALLSNAAPSMFHAYESAFEPALLLHGASVAVLSSYRAEVRREAEALMAKLLDEAGLSRGRLVLRRGNPQRLLPRVHRDSLLVLSRGRSKLRHLVLGSVTRRVIAHGSSDVLLV